jgi:hypothetical protein
MNFIQIATFMLLLSSRDCLFNVESYIHTQVIYKNFISWTVFCIRKLRRSARIQLTLIHDALSCIRSIDCEIILSVLTNLIEDIIFALKTFSFITYAGGLSYLT